MNKTIISQLKRTLKKYGIRNADTIVNQTIKMNYEKFLDYADPVYVIDRIASCYEDPTALKKLENANREWLAIVIDKGWCKELDTYIKEFGHKLTLAAIYYCIENNTWQTWKGKFSLQTKSNDYWSGLAYISDAAFYLKDSGKFDPNAPELNGIFVKENTEEVAAPAALVTTTAATTTEELTTAAKALAATVLGDSVAEPTTPPSPTADIDEEALTYPADNAFDAVTHSRSILATLQKDLDIIEEFTVLHADTTDTIKELTKYKTRYESIEKKYNALNAEYQKALNDIDTLTKEKNDLSSLLAIRNDELGDAERTAHDLEEKLKEAQDVISGHSVDMLQSESKFRDLEDKYNNLLDNYEEIKQQAQMPVKKQLKYEDLISLPFVGQAVLKQIIPFLEHKGIVVVK